MPPSVRTDQLEEGWLCMAWLARYRCAAAGPLAAPGRGLASLSPAERVVRC